MSSSTQSKPQIPAGTERRVQRRVGRDWCTVASAMPDPTASDPWRVADDPWRAPHSVETKAVQRWGRQNVRVIEVDPDGNEKDVTR